MEEEGVVGTDPGVALLECPLDHLVEQFGATVERLAEGLPLRAHPLGDPLALVDDQGVGRTHHLDRSVGEPLQPVALQAQGPPLLDCPPHHPPQDVAPLLVRGDHARGQEESHSPRVVGDDPHRPGRLLRILEADPAHLDRKVDQRGEEVGLEHGGHVLEDGGHSLEAHAGIDVSPREGLDRAVFPQVVGHEDVVPVLEETIGVIAGTEVVGAELGSAIEVHLRAGTARPGRAGLPEVLFAREPNDPLVRKAELPPDRDRFIVRADAQLLVAAEDGDPDQGRIDPEPLDRELPPEGDRLLLEVVTEAEIAEHLEEGEVAHRLAHLFDVGCPEAGLGGGKPGCGGVLGPEEVGLEGLHPGDRQHRRGILGWRNQRGRGHPAVVPFLEESKERLPYRVGFHPDRAYSIVPWPTIAEPRIRTAVCPGADPAKACSSRTSSRSCRPRPAETVAPTGSER